MADENKLTPEALTAALVALSPAERQAKIFELQHERLVKRQKVPFVAPAEQAAPVARPRPGTVGVVAQVVRD